jgi:hypothetical protein
MSSGAQVGTSEEMVSQSPRDVRSFLTARITFLLAAEVIAAPGFPVKDPLPKVKPFPFTTFGHQPLFDYKLLLAIVWTVIEEMQSELASYSHAKTLAGCWMLGAGVLGLIMAASTEAGLALVAIFLLALGGLLMYLGKGPGLKPLSAIRAKAIESLIDGLWEKQPSPGMLSLIEKYSNRHGDGAIDGSRVPVVIVASDSHPFPGFGRLQAQETYLCAPKDSEEGQGLMFEQIEERLLCDVKQAIRQAGVEHVTFGDIVAVYGSSIPMGSGWLEQTWSPKLWLERSELDRLAELDPRVSVRRFFAIEILFPETMTSAYFFLRPFLSGCAASVHVVMTTLGPPAHGPLFFRRRLIRHKVEEKEGLSTEVAKPYERKSTKWEDDLENVRLARWLSKDDSKFQESIDVKLTRELKVTKLEELDELAKEEYKKEVKDIVEESVFWPGSTFMSQNWRETHSLTFTTDFFGRPEAIATVRSVFERLSTALLRSLEELGFDASAYRDQEGKYHIDVEKIDQLIVGERISLIKQEHDKGESRAREPEAAQAASVGGG